MKEIILFILAIIPGILVCYYIISMDKYESEPKWPLTMSFIFGALSVIPVYYVEQWANQFVPYYEDPWWQHLLFCIFCIGFVEEFFKFIALMGYNYHRPYFNEPLDGIVYSTMIGMGFACVENLIYAQTFDVTTIMVRFFTAIPAHAGFAVIMGFYVGKAKFAVEPLKRNILIIKGFSIAFILHGLYDFFIFQQYYEWLSFVSILILAGVVYYARKAIKLQQASSPYRTDPYSELTISELAHLDKLRFVKDEEVIHLIMERLTFIRALENDWAFEYLDPETGDIWLQYQVMSDFSGDVSKRLLRLPELDTNGIIKTILSPNGVDETIEAAHYLKVKSDSTGEDFRESLLSNMEALNIDELNDWQKQRIVNLLKQTALISAEPVQMRFGARMMANTKDFVLYGNVPDRARRLYDNLLQRIQNV